MVSSWEYDIIPPYELFDEFDCNIAIRLWFVASTITSRKDCITVTVHSFWSYIFGRELCGLFCLILAFPANPLLNALNVYSNKEYEDTKGFWGKGGRGRLSLARENKGSITFDKRFLQNSFTWFRMTGLTLLTKLASSLSPSPSSHCTMLRLNNRTAS